MCTYRAICGHRRPPALPQQSSGSSALRRDSPQGDLRVVILSTRVGMRTGPFTLSCLSLAPRMRSAHTAGGQGGGRERGMAGSGGRQVGAQPAAAPIHS